MREFGPFRLDILNQCLWRSTEERSQERILLTPKAFAVLLYLVERAGQLVTHKELRTAIWSDAHVGPGVLNNQILSIRNALGDRPQSPAFIETVARRGYRFIAPVCDAVRASSRPEPDTEPLVAKLVGRRATLNRLRTCLQKVMHKQRQIIFLTGDSGIGKTTLADEFQRQAATVVPRIRIARGQCVEGFGGKEPYFPMLEALGELCHGPSGAIVVQILVSKAPSWLVQLPAALKREHRAILQQDIQGTTRERMLREIGEALEAIASSDPLLLVFEDLHLADPFTLDLLSATARRRASAKLMIVGTYRTCDMDPGHPLHALVRDLLVRRLSDEIVLEPLTESEIAEYLLCQPCSIQTPEVLAALLFRHSAGNPLFVAAFLEHLYNRGMLSKDKGTLRLNVSLDAIDMGVPKSLGRMLEAQIDSLSLEQQQVLEVMSVDSGGRYRFPTAAKAAAIDMEPERFEAICETLSRRHHALRIPTSEKLSNGTPITCYEFVHALYRDVCYCRIPAARRAKLHRRIGEWGEASTDCLLEISACLAEHFERARDWPRTVKYLCLAAEAAGRRSEPWLAEDTLKHALAVLKQLPYPEHGVPEATIKRKLAAIHTARTDRWTAYAVLNRASSHGDWHDGEMMANPQSWISSRRSLDALQRELR